MAGAAHQPFKNKEEQQLAPTSCFDPAAGIAPAA
jgi:hypothetical protein